ncbi:hypothetical protein [Streptomyces sp. LN785]|uniref:hypothetical protein n=1 Tax=Streptomyces sp. LN785 TaxID=3112983 RepID=UPI003720020A
MTGWSQEDAGADLFRDRCHDADETLVGLSDLGATAQTPRIRTADSPILTGHGTQR